MLRRLAAAVLAVAALVAGSTSAAATIDPADQKVVAAGSVGELQWELLRWRQEKLVCYGVRVDELTQGGCLFAKRNPPGKDGLSVGTMSFPTRDGPRQEMIVVIGPRKTHGIVLTWPLADKAVKKGAPPFVVDAPTFRDATKSVYLVPGRTVDGSGARRPRGTAV